MKAAFDKALSGTADQMNALAGSNVAQAASGLLPKVDKIEKVSCTKKTDSVYTCNVKITATAMGTSSANVTEVQFAKTNSGWEVIQ